MFDNKSIVLEKGQNGLATVIAREYRIDNYIFIININGYKINVMSDLNTDLCIGDKCNVKYLPGKEFTIYPDKIKCEF